MLEKFWTGHWLEPFEPKHGNKHLRKNMLHTPGMEAQASMDDKPISHMGVTKVFINSHRIFGSNLESHIKKLIRHSG